jgi:hypothetical protein
MGITTSGQVVFNNYGIIFLISPFNVPLESNIVATLENEIPQIKFSSLYDDQIKLTHDIIKVNLHGKVV